MTQGSIFDALGGASWNRWRYSVKHPHLLIQHQMRDVGQRHTINASGNGYRDWTTIIKNLD
jgi:hypothetical protein